MGILALLYELWYNKKVSLDTEYISGLSRNEMYIVYQSSGKGTAVKKPLRVGYFEFWFGTLIIVAFMTIPFGGADVPESIKGLILPMLGLTWVVGIGLVSGLWVSMLQKELDKPRKITVFVRDLFGENWNAELLLFPDGTMKAPDEPRLLPMGREIPTKATLGFPEYSKKYIGTGNKKVAAGVLMLGEIYTVPVTYCDEKESTVK